MIYTSAMILAELTEQRRIAWRVIALSTFIGALYGMVVAYFLGTASLYTGLLQGAVTGIIIGSGVFAINFLSQRRRWRRQIRRIPFLVLVAVKGLLYLLLFAGTIIGTVRLFYPAGSNQIDWATPSFQVSVVFSAVLSIAFTFILEVRSIVGRSVFQNFLAGRYHRPVSERRLFLFVDLNDSTAIAEEIGDLRYLEFLDDFVQEIAGAVNACHGEVYKYVGDEVIVSWPLHETAAEDCIQAVIGMQQGIKRHTEEYRRHYDRVPSFRAGAHGGRVVAGELGGDRREIAYLGDTINTAARILDYAKQAGETLVISSAVHDILGAEQQAAFSPLGTVRLRGRRRQTGLFALKHAGVSGGGEFTAAARTGRDDAD